VSPQASDAELEVLKVLWQSGPGTVREVEARLRRRRRRWAYNTILTLLSRLREKGFVASDKSDAAAHVFRATVTRDKLLVNGLSELADRVYGGGGIDLGAGEEDVAGFAAEHDDAVVESFAGVGFLGGNDLFYGAGRKVDLIDAGGGGEGEFFAVGGERVLMEVHTLGVGFVGESDDAVAGVFVDPFFRGGLCASGRADVKRLAGVGVAALDLGCGLGLGESGGGEE